tara:strand:- start:783 stop:1811 length:1029 start_codon:yes stop_codon:yes gene_type:complete
MSLKKDFKQSGEIDLVEMAIILWKNKWKIFLTSFIAAIIAIVYQASQDPIKLSYVAKTEIRPISTFDEFDYEVYNSYLKNVGSQQMNYAIQYKDKAVIINEANMDMDNSSFKNINKSYLINLFIERLNENSFFTNLIKESELIKKENYKDDVDYENAILKTAENIKLTSINNESEDIKADFIRTNSWLIQYKTDDKESWEKFLKYVEKSTNLSIQNYLISTFENLIKNQKEIKKYRIEDINLEIKNIENDEALKNKLLTNRQRLKDEKDIERLVFAFETTPLSKKNEFQAAKILYTTTFYENIGKKRTPFLALIIMSIVFGGLTGIFYVLFKNALENRRQKP